MSYYNSSPVLPIGRVNLESGKSKYFNVYETWGEDTTYELYKTSEGKYRIVATAGVGPINKIGNRGSFIHDQTHNFYFEGTMIDFAVGSGLKKFAEKYGVKTIAGSTYK